MPSDDAGLEPGSPREAARQAFRSEISDALSGIVDRDHFLQRLARRVAEVTGIAGVAIYTRPLTGGDFLLRSSTVPKTERVPPRVSPDAPEAQGDVVSVNGGAAQPRQVVSYPILGSSDTMGALVLYSGAGLRFGDSEQQIFAGIAEEIAPAIAVAEHHHAVKQASVIDLTTGAYASWYVTQRFDEEIARAQRTRNPVTLVLVSILEFDSLQLAIGYERTDQVLRDLASEYAGLTRVFDIVGMRSRSEFSILLPETEISSAATVIARIHQRSARVLEKLSEETGADVAHVVTGASSFPLDGDRVPTISLAAEHRLNQNEILHRRMAEQA